MARASSISPTGSTSCAPSAIASRSCATARGFTRGRSQELTTAAVDPAHGRPRGDVDLPARARCARSRTACVSKVSRAKACCTTSRSNSVPVRSSDSAGLVGAGRTELCRALVRRGPNRLGTRLPFKAKPIRLRNPGRCGARRHRAYTRGSRARRARAPAADRATT